MSSDWNLVQTATGDALVKQFDRGDFKGSVAFLDQILPLAEAADHHPAIQLDILPTALVAAGVPRRRPEVTNGLSGSKGMPFLLQVM